MTCDDRNPESDPHRGHNQTHGEVTDKFLRWMCLVTGKKVVCLFEDE